MYWLLLKMYITCFNERVDCYDQCVNDFWRRVISMLLYVVVYVWEPKNPRKSGLAS